MPPHTERRVTRARRLQLLLRVCGLIGAVGLLFCVIAINKVSSTVGWIIRIAPAVAIVHTIYGIYHLCKAATGRTPGSTASYMVFAGVVDSGLIPFFVFSAWLAHADYSENKYGWSTLFNDSELSYKIIYALFILSCTEGAIILASLLLDIYLGLKFKQIARLPPDLNPLEPNLTSRHKRNKSEGITEKNMKASELAAKRGSQGAGFKRVPFIHTRTDSADSVTLYGSENARNSRLEFRKDLEDSEKDPWRWSRSSSPERPSSVVNPSPSSRTAGAGLDYRPERSSGLAKQTSRPSSWLSYLDYEGVPSLMSDEATGELDHEVRPVSPVSALSARDTSPDKMQTERGNWYQGTVRNSQAQLPPNGSQIFSNPKHASRMSLHQQLQVPSPEPQPKRSREPLAMNPPTPSRPQFNNENMYSTPPRQAQAADYTNRLVLHDANANGQARPNAGSRPSSFIGSGGKARFYGSLRSSAGSVSSQDDKKEARVSMREVEDLYERTRTMQTESDYSTNFEVYASDSDDEKLSANAGHMPQSQWNGVRQTSNSTGHDLGSGYAGLGSDFGQGMGRRRDVSGKMAEEGRASPPKNGAAGWARFKGL